MLEGNPDLAILHVSRDYQANGKTCLNYRTACPSMVVDVGGLFIPNVMMAWQKEMEMPEIYCGVNSSPDGYPRFQIEWIFC